jgi:hypothetical protein
MTHPYAKFKDGGAAKAAQYVKPYAGGGEVTKLLKKLASTSKKDYVKETKETLKELAQSVKPKKVVTEGAWDDSVPPIGEKRGGKIKGK